MTLNQSLPVVNAPATFAGSQALDAAWQLSQNLLSTFTGDPDVGGKMQLAFDGNVQSLIPLAASWASGDLTSFPDIEIRPSVDINGALGAFAGELNRIYLSQELLTDNANNVASVLLEELGHALDWQLGGQDAPGDEGNIFAQQVQGVDLDSDTLQALKEEDDTVVLTLDGQLLQLEQATPGVNPAFDLIGLTELRNDPQFADIDGSGVSVAIIDTGLDRTHSLLEGNYITGVDFVNGGNNPVDRADHGTHVAGIVGATDANIGVARDVGLIGLQVFERNGNAYNSTIEDALVWVLDNHEEYNIVAVNMSLGSGFYRSESRVFFDILKDDVQRLEDAGITVVSAAGNDYKDNEYENLAAPAIYSTLAVGAVWQDGTNSRVRWQDGARDNSTGADRIVSFSQRLDGPNVIFAPGAYINSTVPGNDTERSAGTSMASPMVAGTVALMQEAALDFGGRLLSPEEVQEIIITTADSIFDGDDEDDNVDNTNQSYPRLNVYEAVKEIQRRFTGNAPPPITGGSGDSNGTIAGAFLGPVLDGSPVAPLLGAIGLDGNSSFVGDKDVDIFRFEVSSGGNVTIEVSSHPQNPDNFDSLLRLFDELGREIAFDDDGGEGTFSRLEVTLDPGVYFAGVSGYNNGNYNPNVAGSGVAAATGNYSLEFSLINDDPNGTIAGAVAVNLGTDTEPVQFDGLIGADYGESVGVADVDMFEVVAPDNGVLLIDIDTPFNSDYLDSFVRIFDARGNEVRVNGSPLASDDDLATDAEGNAIEFADSDFPGLVFADPVDRNFFSGHATDSFLRATVEQGEIYYIGISDFFNQDYDPTSTGDRPTTGDGGSYNLIVSFANSDLNGSIPQATADVSLPFVQLENIGLDSNPETGRSLEVGDRDVDLVRVRSQTGGILEVNIDAYEAAGIANPADTVAFIFDSAGNQLAFDDDSNSFDPLIQLPIEANQDYFVAVTGYGNGNFDPFQLSSGSGGDEGDYILNLRLLSASESSSLSNDRIDSIAVQELAIDSEVLGNIGADDGFAIGPTDIDLYRFGPDITGMVDIRTSTNLLISPENPSADTFLRVFDAEGNEIAFNDDENNGTRGSFLQVAVTAGTEYIIGVNGYSSQARNYDPITGAGAAAGSMGDYLLSVTSSNDGGGFTDTEDDFLTGTPGRDRISGENGNDTVLGGGGNDVLAGGAGNDLLNGEAGRDLLLGGTGNDIFVLDSAVANARQADLIRDFESGIDAIGLTEGLTAGDLNLRSVRGNNTLIRIEESRDILGIVLGATPDELSFV